MQTSSKGALMKFLVIVTENPQESSLAATALRFVKAAGESGHEVPAVFFHNEGVFNAVDNFVSNHWHASNEGFPSLSQDWQETSIKHDTRMLVCSAAFARRTDNDRVAVLPDIFEPAGLPLMWDIAGQCDRVVTF
jgi:sulfur relay protein TusD/DsrE